MRAAVLGGAGHVGNAVVRRLLEQDWEVIAIGRPPRTPANLEGLAADYRAADTDDPAALEPWLDGCELIVDAAAPYPLHAFWAPPGAGLQRQLAERRTEALIEAVARTGATLGCISSFTTVARRRQPLDEVQRRFWRQLHPYFEVKQVIEERLLAAAADGLPVVIVNPTSCLGPWDVKPVERCLVPRLLRGEVAAIAEHVINVVDVRDVAAGLLASLASERFGRPTLLSGHSLTVSDLAAWICELGDGTPPAWKLPAGLGIAPSLLLEGALALGGRPSPSPTLVLMLLCEQTWALPDGEQRELGLRIRPLSQTLRDTIGWYRRLGYF